MKSYILKLKFSFKIIQIQKLKITNKNEIFGQFLINAQQQYKLHAFFTIIEFWVDSKIEWPQNPLTLMSRSKRVKVHSFPGATISDMGDYLKPLIKRDQEELFFAVKPMIWILHSLHK